MLLTTIIGAVYVIIIAKPLYASTSTLYVYRKMDNLAQVKGELDTGAKLVNDIAVLIKNREIATTVLNRLNLNDIYSSDDIVSKITTKVQPETRILKVTIIDRDPDMAALIANTVSDVFVANFQMLMTGKNVAQQEYVNIVEKAIANEAPVKPNKKTIILMSIMLGIALGAGIIFLIEILDDTVKSPESLEMHINTKIIGVIPIITEN